MLYYEEEGSAIYGPTDTDAYFHPQQNLHDAQNICTYALTGLKSESI